MFIQGEENLEVDPWFSNPSLKEPFLAPLPMVNVSNVFLLTLPLFARTFVFTTVCSFASTKPPKLQN